MALSSLELTHQKPHLLFPKPVSGCKPRLAARPPLPGLAEAFEILVFTKAKMSREGR